MTASLYIVVVMPVQGIHVWYQFRKITMILFLSKWFLKSKAVRCSDIHMTKAVHFSSLACRCKTHGLLWDKHPNAIQSLLKQAMLRWGRKNKMHMWMCVPYFHHPYLMISYEGEAVKLNIIRCPYINTSKVFATISSRKVWAHHFNPVGVAVAVVVAAGGGEWVCLKPSQPQLHL